MIHSLMRRARSKRTPSLVAIERKDTKGADPRTERGVSVANCWEGLALPVCACVSLVFRSLASVPPVFVVRVCSCGFLLRCLAVLPLSLCPLALSPLFFTFDGHRPKNRKNLWAVHGCTSLGSASQRFSERGRKNELSIYNGNPVACDRHLSTSGMLDAALQQTGKKKRQVPPLSGISPCAGYIT